MDRNDHWNEWRTAVSRTGFTPELKRAAGVLLALDSLTVEQVEEIFKQAGLSEKWTGAWSSRRI